MREKRYRDFALFMTGIYTGLRVSDLVRLYVNDVAYLDVKGRFKIRDRMNLQEHKTGKFRDILLHPTLRRVLGHYLRKRTAERNTWAGFLFEPLFPSQRLRSNGEYRLTERQVWWLLRNAASACGIKYKVGTHSMRKTFGYMLYQNGVNIEVIQRIFNHASPLITLAYIGITQDDLDEAIMSLEALGS